MKVTKTLWSKYLWLYLSFPKNRLFVLSNQCLKWFVTKCHLEETSLAPLPASRCASALHAPTPTPASSRPESRRRERSAQLTDQPRQCHGNQPLNHGKQGRYRSHKSNSRAAEAYEFAAPPSLSSEEGGQGKFARVMGGEKAVIFYKSTLSSSWWGERVEGCRATGAGDRALRWEQDLTWYGPEGKLMLEREKNWCVI